MTCVCYNVEFFRVAKRHTDEKSFFGGQLHVCYAPEYETVEETRQKLQDRRRYVNRASQNTGIVNDVNCLPIGYICRKSI